MLAQSGTINFRNIGDDYYAIVPPETDLSESEVRRAYLQFILDPVLWKNSKDILTLKEGIKALLDVSRKTNLDVSPDIFFTSVMRLVTEIGASRTARGAIPA